MRKLLLVPVLLAGVVYAVWVSGPETPHSAEIAASISSARARVEAAHLQDAGSNGYLSPEFLPLWGPQGRPTPDDKVRIDWQRSFVSARTEVDHRLISRVRGPWKPDAAFNQAWKAWLPLQSRLLAAFAKPHFAGPGLNLTEFRSLLFCLSAAADTLTLQGQTSQAAELALTMMHQGRVVAQDQPALYLIVGLAVQQSALEATNRIVLVGTSAADQRLVDGIAAELIPADATAASMDAELGVDHQLWERPEPLQALIKTYPVAIKLKRMQWLPGRWMRERRLYDNDAFAVLQALRAGQLPPARWHGLASALLLPSVVRCEILLRAIRAKFAGVRMLLALRCYRSEHGQWPKTLAELTGRQLPGFDFHYFPADGSLELTVDPVVQRELAPRSLHATPLISATATGLRFAWPSP
jgi:hypothetical protein